MDLFIDREAESYDSSADRVEKAATFISVVIEGIIDFDTSASCCFVTTSNVPCPP